MSPLLAVQAESAYATAARLAPDRVVGMDIYSSVLWHLRRESTLSYLAHRLAADAPMAPETWVVAGNCFSLQKEHDQAIKFFERAIQV